MDRDQPNFSKVRCYECLTRRMNSIDPVLGDEN